MDYQRDGDAMRYSTDPSSCTHPVSKGGYAGLCSKAAVSLIHGNHVCPKCLSAIRDDIDQQRTTEGEETG